MRGSSARALGREEELGALGAEEVAVVVGRRRKSREMVGGGRGSGSGAGSGWSDAENEGRRRAWLLVRRGSGRIPRKKGTSGDGTSSRGIRECGWRRLRDVMDGWDSLGLGLGWLYR